MEIKIKNFSELPKFIYHLVPENIFNNFIDKEGNYDCRNKEEWGNNSPFIHTSPNKKQLKERVADINWSNFPREQKFLLLEINSEKLKNTKITYSVINGFVYHHIWGPLLRGSFGIFKVDRFQNGKFSI